MHPELEKDGGNRSAANRAATPQAQICNVTCDSNARFEARMVIIPSSLRELSISKFLAISDTIYKSLVRFHLYKLSWINTLYLAIRCLVFLDAVVDRVAFERRKSLRRQIQYSTRPRRGCAQTRNALP